MYTIDRLLNEPYTWGKINKVHSIGNYIIAEYYPDKRDGVGGFIDGQYEDTLSYHPYINGNDTNQSLDSLDNALIHCVSCSAGHSRASEFIINMLSVKY